MVAIFDKVLRAGEGRTLKKLKGLAQQVNALEQDFVALSDDELRALTAQYRERLDEGETLDDLLPEAFATVREAARRTLGQRHYDVQLMGGAALHLGNIAEMKTGEGKTLVSTLPAYLNALSGKGVHVVTVNDYLAERDSAWMGRVHRFLGLDVGCILATMSPAERREAYAADITYGTNNEFGFDYLRDNMAWTTDEMVQRGHNFAIVDEVDSILVDEARTPLIISGPSDSEPKWFSEFARLAARLTPDEDYEVDIKKRTVGILEPGVENAEDWLGIDNLYEASNTALVGFLNNAIKAKELFLRDRDYVVMDGEVLIIDEHTGRILQGRRYNEGLHQAIEAKEGVEVKAENQTLATITLQNFFRLYDKLGGMTGTAMTEAAEFNQIYNLGVVPIPTNREMVRADQADLIYRTENAKFNAVVEDVAERFQSGQPVLIGTVSVEKSELLSNMLRKQRIPHEVLNAKYHEREASIVAEAGRKGAVVVATNMAGRGTDIMLGGNPEFRAAAELERRGLSAVDDPEAYEAEWPKALAEAEASVAAEHEEVVGLGGLYVLGTERHESRRIDNQLRGRSGRQGDPGETRFYLSLEDSLMRRFNAAMVDSFLTRFNVPDEQPIEAKMVSRAIQSAQSQVEAQNFEIRKNILKYDEVLNKQRQVIYAERRSVLEGDDLEDQMRTFTDDAVAAVVLSATAEGYAEDWDLDALWRDLGQLYPVGLSQEAVIAGAGGERNGLTSEFLLDQFQEDAQVAYDNRAAQVGDEQMRELERRVILSVVDKNWREHLYEMDYLQEGIGLRAMAQRDPLVEYQREGYDMFVGMMERIKADAVGHVFHVEVPEDLAQAEDPADMDAVIDAAIDFDTNGALGQGPYRPAEFEYSSPSLDDEAGVEHHSSASIAAAATATQQAAPARPAAPAPSSASGPLGSSATRAPEFEGVSRNAPCPCGSGKKFKRCHGDPRNAA